ncbi:MAG: hypothetical protein AAB870_03815, partial [Patescibacteria group bacterium]
WSWSEIYGWICWGKACADASLSDSSKYGSSVAPDGSAPKTIVKLTSGTFSLIAKDNTVSGWAKVITLKDDGWIKLDGQSVSGSQYFTYYDSITAQFNGWAWSCVPGTDPSGCNDDRSIGWIVFSGKTLVDPTLSNVNEACPSDPITGAPNLTCALYSYDAATANKDSKWYTEFIGPWLESQGGNIYGNGGVSGAGLKPPLQNGKYNSSYLIHSNGAITAKWVSECPGDSCGVRTGNPPTPSQTPKTLVGDFDSPSNPNRYRNNLGFINIAALTDPAGSDGKNRYGYSIQTISTNNFVRSTAPLNNTVFVRTGDLDIGPVSNPNYFTVYAGGPATSGAGTVIVKGDLRIHAPIVYEKSAVSSVVRTPSVAWIVIKDDNGNGGNIIIDPCIVPPFDTNPAGPVILSGAFIAEGTITTGYGASSSGDRGVGFEGNQCSSIKNGGTFPNDDIPLQVNGIMMAHDFNFQRIYVGNDTGGESIRDDGRLFANVLPGLEDMAKKLPLWKSNRYVP